MKRAISILLAFCMLALAGCSEVKIKDPEPIKTAPAVSETPETYVPTEEPAAQTETVPPAVYYDEAAWYCPLQDAWSPAKVINIAAGEVVVACPDPLCSHSEGSETCFFNTSRDDTMVYAAEYLNGHIYFAADKQTDDGRIMKLYDFDMDGGRIDEIYTFSFVQSMVGMHKNSHTLFFTDILGGEEGDSEAWRIGLFSYDPDTKAVTLLDDDARFAVGEGDAVFFDDYYIRSAGHSADGESYYYCRCSYDGVRGESFDSLPDGTRFSPMGWSLKPSGVFANTWGEGGMYLIEDGVKLMFPTDSPVTSPVRYKDDYYFQTWGREYVKIGRDPYTNAEHRSYTYDNEIYVMNKDGSFKHYSVDCEYHFVTVAAYEKVLIGLIQYRIPAPGQCMMGGDSDTYIMPDVIRVDLETGEVTLYDTTLRNGFVKETFTCGIRLNEE